MTIRFVPRPSVPQGFSRKEALFVPDIFAVREREAPQPLRKSSEMSMHGILAC